MYPVTQDFQEKMKSDARRVLGRIKIDYTDPFIDQSISASANEQAGVSHIAQTADAVLESTHKWASLDGVWRLDGTYHLAPETDEEAKTLQMGWWGATLAGDGGGFSIPYPTLTVEHASRPVHSLRVVGDSKREEYPVDFEIRLYDSGSNVLHTETVTGNSEITWAKAVSINKVAKSVLEIRRWSHEGRQVKILEFFTSVQEVYEGDDIILINLLEERETSEGSLPVGNISANEIDIRLDNATRKFDAGNTQSPLYQLLKPNRRIRAWLGTDDGEYVPLGVFWSGDWSAPEDGLYAATTGRDRLDMLAQSTYNTSQVAMNVSLYELAEAVLQDAGLEPEEYSISADLQTYVVPYAWFGTISHREALRLIAEASLSVAYCDRHGTIRVEPFVPAESESLLVTADDYFRKDNPAKWAEVANVIEVETQPLRPDAMQEVYRSNEPVSIESEQTLTLTVFYNEPPCIEAVAGLEDAPVGCTIQEAIYYAWGATVKVYSETAGAFVLVVTAKPLKVLNKERAVARDEQSITEHGILRYRYPSNPLVQTLDVAELIAGTLLASFREPRRDLEMEWRGNPALLLGDRVTVTDKNEQNDYYVTRQEIEWAGTLRARLSGRRV